MLLMLKLKIENKCGSFCEDLVHPKFNLRSPFITFIIYGSLFTSNVIQK